MRNPEAFESHAFHDTNTVVLYATALVPVGVGGGVIGGGGIAGVTAHAELENVEYVILFPVIRTARMR